MTELVACFYFSVFRIHYQLRQLVPSPPVNRLSNNTNSNKSISTDKELREEEIAGLSLAAKLFNGGTSRLFPNILGRGFAPSAGTSPNLLSPLNYIVSYRKYYVLKYHTYFPGSFNPPGPMAFKDVFFFDFFFAFFELSLSLPNKSCTSCFAFARLASALSYL